MLEQPPARLRAYPPETVVAEKFLAMVALGMFNNRLKDFYDLWAIAGAFDFDDSILALAIQTTFGRRKTPLPQETPIALTLAYPASKGTQWAAFLRRTELADAPEPFPSIQARIVELVMPPTLALIQGQAFDTHWRRMGPWTEAS